MTDADLEFLERRLREQVRCLPAVVRGKNSYQVLLLTEAADVLASLRSERTQLQGLIQTWRGWIARLRTHHNEMSEAIAMDLSKRVDQLEAVLSEGRPSSEKGADTKT